MAVTRRGSAHISLRMGEAQLAFAEGRRRAMH